MNLLNSKMHGEMERSERGPAFDKMQKQKQKQKWFERNQLVYTMDVS